MEILHSDEICTPPFGVSIFLAGPTPRSSSVLSWRPTAVDILSSIDFHGFVFVPERNDWTVKFDYVDQIEWELAGLLHCGVIAFWVPRDTETMPAFTTNVEFGMYINSGKILYGRPDGAPHTRYLDHLYNKITGMKPFSSLNDLMVASVDKANKVNYGF